MKKETHISRTGLQVAFLVEIDFIKPETKNGRSQTRAQNSPYSLMLVGTSASNYGIVFLYSLK